MFDVKLKFNVHINIIVLKVLACSKLIIKCFCLVIQKRFFWYLQRMHDLFLNTHRVFGLLDVEYSTFDIKLKGSTSTRSGTRCHAYRVEETHGSINARRNFLSLRVARVWNYLPILKLYMHLKNPLIKSI